MSDSKKLHTLDYRPEIDGLRSFAIIPVVLFHAGVSLFSGGFLGVDVFFVISGYLITSILVQNARKGQLSILKFYEKRARRILPALFLMIFTTSIIYPLFNSHPSDLSDYGLSILSVLAFVSNIYFWTEAGYFGTASEMTPLLHTWSLAVEEQFYIFLPLIILYFYSQYRRFLGVGGGLIIFASLMIAEWGAQNSAEANFYLLPSRIWELFIGSMCALYYDRVKESSFYSQFSKTISIIALFGLTTCFFIFDSETRHPSILTAIPVLFVATILLFSAEKSLAKTILSHKLLIWIGLLSYSIYLWHQPILVIFKTLYGQHLSVLYILVALSITLLLSWLSWKYVEAPYRNSVVVNNKKLVKHGVFCSLICFGIALFFINNKAFQKLLDPESIKRFNVIEEAINHEMNRPVSRDCHLWSPSFDDSFISEYDKCSEKYGRAVFILGGSHGMDMYNVISSSFDTKFVVSVSRGFCRIHAPLFGKRPHRCQYDDFLAFVDDRADTIETLIYTQTGDRLLKNGLQNASSPEISDGAIHQVVKYMATVQKKYGLNVTIVGSLPTLNFGPKRLDYKIPLHSQLSEMYSERLVNLSTLIDSRIEKVAAAEDVRFIRKTHLFKLKLPDDLIVDGKLTYSDSRHISKHGAIVFGKRILKEELL